MEVTIFDKNGVPTAYIADDMEHSIYTWDGYAVCYLYGQMIYGWRGKHIGWFVGEIMYDMQGYRIGFTRNTCPRMTRLEPLKKLKKMKYLKSLRRLPKLRPFFKYQNSEQPLLDFLCQDRP